MASLKQWCNFWSKLYFRQ